MNVKRIGVTISVAAIIILALRFYILDMAVKCFNFGCDTAALKVQLHYHKEAGLELKQFCREYTNNIKKYP